jgi:hypothetical protein
MKADGSGLVWTRGSRLLRNRSFRTNWGCRQALKLFEKWRYHNCWEPNKRSSGTLTPFAPLSW